MGATSNCSIFSPNTSNIQNNAASSVKFQVEALEKPFPIYSSVVKKKSNPARDFALTVLENDKKAVKTKETCDLNEISQLLTTTNQLLTRNSHLRASLTIRVQRSNSKKDSTKTVFVLPKTENLVDVIIDAAATASSSSASEANIAGLQKSKNSADQGNLLKGIVIWSLVQSPVRALDSHSSNTFLFISTFTNNVGQHCFVKVTT